MAGIMEERARVAALTRSRDPGDPELVEARQNLRAAVLAQHIEHLANEMPALTADQRDRLVVLLLRRTETDS
jgi:hypothetical protein